jgi:hypothetical protein
LATFAALALSIFFLTRTAAQSPTAPHPANVIGANAVPAPLVIKSYPADAVIIEALPPK